MNEEQKRLYADALSAIEVRIADLKRLVSIDQAQPVGVHWLVQSLGGMECLAFGIRMAVIGEPKTAPTELSPL